MGTVYGLCNSLDDNGRTLLLHCSQAGHGVTLSSALVHTLSMFRAVQGWTPSGIRLSAAEQEIVKRGIEFPTMALHQQVGAPGGSAPQRLSGISTSVLRMPPPQKPLH